MSPGTAGTSSRALAARVGSCAKPERLKHCSRPWPASGNLTHWLAGQPSDCLQTVGQMPVTCSWCFWISRLRRPAVQPALARQLVASTGLTWRWWRWAIRRWPIQCWRRCVPACVTSLTWEAPSLEAPANCSESLGTRAHVHITAASPACCAANCWWYCWVPRAGVGHQLCGRQSGVAGTACLWRRRQDIAAGLRHSGGRCIALLGPEKRSSTCCRPSTALTALTETFIASAFARHSSGFSLLPMPSQAERMRGNCLQRRAVIAGCDAWPFPTADSLIWAVAATPILWPPWRAMPMRFCW